MDQSPRRILFLCRHNRMRSPTAERVFRKRVDLDVRSAGTAADALARVNDNMLDWAEDIFIMDEQQRRSLRRRFSGHPALDRLICLDIPDEFTFLQPELIELLENRITPHLPRAGHASCPEPADPDSSDSPAKPGKST